MFGYLNLADPTKIGDTESQEAVNVRLDRGYLEYATWPLNNRVNRTAFDLSGRSLLLEGAFSVVPAYRLKSGNNDTIGIELPRPVDGFDPGAVPGSRPLFGGAFDPSPRYYAITVYDPDTNEESKPYYVTLQTAAATFQDFPGIHALHPHKTNLKYRIYRRPVGSSEYLLLGFDIAGYNDNATVYTDVFADHELGAALSMVDCKAIRDYGTGSLFLPQNFELMHVHNSRLWLACDRTLIYSKPFTFGEMRELNYFKIKGAMTGLFTVNEALVILTTETVYILYGDSDTDFVLKEIDSPAVGACGFSSADSLLSTVLFLGKSPKETGSIPTGLFSLSGGQIQKLSHKVQELFPSGFYINGCAVTDDRFFAVALPIAGHTTGVLVFDSLTQGFLTGDSGTTTFRYRSKEFGTPGWWDKSRRMFVRGCGDFKLELYGDYEKFDEIDFSISGTQPETHEFTIPGYRHNYFSYRFIGQSNAKIHEFGRKG